MKIDNLRLKTKALIPLGVMYLAVFGMAGFGAYRLDAVSRAASEIIAHRDKAAMYVARATRTAMMAPYSVFGALIYEGSSPEGRTAQSDFFAQSDKLDSLLDTAAQNAPDYASTFAGMKKKFHEIAEDAKKPLAIGEDSPGLAAGKDLNREDLEKLAVGAREVADVDAAARKMASGLLTLSDTMINENGRAAVELSVDARFALVALAAAALLSAIVAGALMTWISTVKIARPLDALSRRMKALAEGDLEVEIAGATRRDEIGDMARVVLVLRDSARERVRLESAARASRASAEAERNGHAAERMQSSAEQAEAVSRVGAALHAVAEGDLTVRLDQGFSAAYLPLKHDFNGAILRLDAAMRLVIATAGTISAGSHSISAATDHLAHRTTEQGASLETTAAALRQISAALVKSANGAALAREVVAVADGEAKASAEVVGRAVGAMDAIAKSASEISQIIGVIDEIAFQTNLLALNAGVEAARAGEAGRGFAVVASEVRALALRSASAARQIKQLIGASSAQVGEGVKLVGETGAALERIVAEVSKVTGIVGDIAERAREQSTGLSQVDVAVGEMENVTRENAAMVGETGSATGALSADAARLSELVGQFKVTPPHPIDSPPGELRKAAPHGFTVARASGRATAGRR